MDDPQMNTGEKSALAIALAGIIALCYQGGEMLTKHTDWAHFYTPPGVGEILITVGIALATVLAALYVDPGKVIDLIRRK